MTERLLFGLIITLTLAHTALAAIAQDIGTAALIVVVGFGWLTLEARQNDAFTGLFFIFFVALAGIGVLRGLPVPVLLLALLGALAAWDLARFRSRLAALEADLTPALEQDHLRKLGMTLAVGGGVALLPLIVIIPLNFLMVAITTLLVIILVRQALRRLGRNESP